MYFYYFIFLILAIFCLLRKGGREELVFSGILLFFIAACRPEGIDNDYLGYLSYYNNIANDSPVVVEPSFVFISLIVKHVFNNPSYVFVLYACLGVLLKFYAIDKLTQFKNLTVLIYFSNFFLLHEMTQIRAGVASGLLLLCIEPIRDRNLLKFLILALIAIFFHFSAIVILPLYFLQAKELNVKAYLALIPIAYILAFLKIDIYTFTSSIPIPLLQSKVGSYSFYADEDNGVNLFNYVHLSRCLIASLIAWRWRSIMRYNSNGILMIKIYIISLFVFVAFSSIPGISSRTSELLQIVEIILLPFVCYIFREKTLILVSVILVGLVFLSFSLFYTKLFTGYF